MEVHYLAMYWKKGTFTRIIRCFTLTTRKNSTCTRAEVFLFFSARLRSPSDNRCHLVFIEFYLQLWNACLEMHMKEFISIVCSDCRLKLPDVNCNNGTMYTNGSCYDNGTFLGLWNTSLFTEVTGRRRVSPSEEYFKYNLKFFYATSC